MAADIRYARNGDVSLAYQVTGDGPLDLVFVSGFVSHQEVMWDDPSAARIADRIGSFARLIRYDKRDQGLSDRLGRPPDARGEHGRPARGDGRGRLRARRAVRGLRGRADVPAVRGDLPRASDGARPLRHLRPHGRGRRLRHRGAGRAAGGARRDLGQGLGRPRGHPDVRAEPGARCALPRLLGPAAALGLEPEGGGGPDGPLPRDRHALRARPASARRRS